MNPRQARVVLSLGRGATWGLGLLAIGLGGGLFAGGYWFGLRAESANRQAPYEAVAAPVMATSSPRSAREPAVVAAMDPRPAPPATVLPSAPPPAPVPTSTTTAAVEAPSAASETPEVEAPEPQVDLRFDAPDDGYGLQVGAYPSESEARAFVARHAASFEGMPVHMLRAQVRDEVWFRIRVGHFAARGPAKAARGRLAGALADGAIVVRYR